MNPRSLLSNREYSLRQAFTLTNSIILVVGLFFTTVTFTVLFKARQDEVTLRLANETEVAGREVDLIHEDARETAQKLAEELPAATLLSRSALEEWLDREGTALIVAKPALYSAYFALARPVAQRLYHSPAMAYAVRKDPALVGTPAFDDPKTFLRERHASPIYQSSPAEIWYQGAIRRQSVNITPLYFDATYFKRAMYSVTKSSRNLVTGELLGVTGVDLTMKSLARAIADIHIGKTGGVLLANLDGLALAPFIGRDIPMLGQKSDPSIETRPDFSLIAPGTPSMPATEGYHTFTGRDGKRYLLQTRKLRTQPFLVMAYQERDEAYLPLYWTLAGFLFLAASALFISLYFRHRLARFVILNIDKILANITDNREHFTGNGLMSEYRHLQPEGPREVARIAHQLNLLYQRLQSSFAEVRAEKDRAELAARAKSRFLSVMSHEIRTPLNAMLGLTDVLFRSPLNSEQAQHLRVLQRAGQSLLRILNDILDFSRLEAGKLRIEPHEFTLYELLHDIESLMRSNAEAKGLTFRVMKPPSDIRLSGDSIRISQALLNLLGNAIKFTRTGGVEVRVVPLAKPGTPVRSFRFEVSDTGIGMDDVQLTKIFLEFSQADASITRRYGGTGLGLAISRHIVELLGGHIAARSEPGRGSTFEFTVPLGVVGPCPPAALDPREEIDSVIDPPPSTLSANHPILIVDDDEDNHRLLAAYLKFHPGLRAEHAYSADEAMAKVQLEKYALLFMDMQMPEVDGLDAIQKIRDLEKSGTISRHAIVMLSANAFPDDRRKSIEAGANEHHPKPITLIQFEAILKRWLPAV